MLASVVLGSLNAARTKGADAAIKANLSGMRSQAEDWYDTTGNASSYSTVTANDAVCTAGMFADVQIKSALEKVKSNSGNAAGTICAIGSQSYAISVPLKSASTKAWCVDNAGNSKEETAGTTGIVGNGGTIAFSCL